MSIFDMDCIFKSGVTTYERYWFNLEIQIRSGNCFQVVIENWSVISFDLNTLCISTV